MDDFTTVDFRVVKKGFDMKEVNEYIGVISSEYQKLWAKLEAVKKENETLKDENERLTKQADSIRNEPVYVQPEKSAAPIATSPEAISAALIKAEILSNDIIEKAKIEAEDIKSAAKTDAFRIKIEADEKLNAERIKAQTEIEKLESIRTSAYEEMRKISESIGTLIQSYPVSFVDKETEEEAKDENV